MIDNISLSFRIPEKKVSKLKDLLDSTIQAGYSSFRELVRIAGTIISVALAVGPISRLLTRQMYFAIETRSAWDNTIHFSTSLLLELKFWYCNIDCLNGYSIRPPLATQTVVFSDASFVAFGGFSASQRHVGTRGYRPKFYVPRTESYLFRVAFLRYSIIFTDN